MDFSKAFDSIKHSILSEKLKKARLNPYVINWLIDFLSDRKQRVVHNNVVTEWKCVNRGTTQGSVNGPYLFSLFLNDLLIDEPQSASLIKHADGSTVVIPVCRGKRNESEKVRHSFLHWTEINNMKCNTDKCKEVSLIKRSLVVVLQ